MTKKANGVYYTPQPVVDYIVKNTLGPLLVGKSPMALAGCTATWQRDSGKYPLTILDPACGSGHLLLGAYRFLLEWFLKWYIEDDADYWLRSSHPRLQRIHGSLQLCVCERQRILSEHIYGVDTDEQAIDIANHELLEEMTDEACDERQLLEISVAGIV